MKKLGRNDRCHCGSGLKYKKCCLPLDEAANITRIIRPEPTSLHEVIYNDLEWPNEMHRLIALHFLQNTKDLYDQDKIEAIIILWNTFTHKESPVSKKLGVYPAVLEYLLCQLFEYGTTQRELANKYNISVTTLSQRYNQLYEFLESQNLESQNIDSRSFPNISLGNSSPMIMEQELARIHALLEKQEFNSIDEVNAFFQQNINNLPSTKEVASNEEKASELIYQAWDETNINRKMKLAQNALQLDPNCIDAYNIFAECTSSLKEKAYYYKQGMLVGEKHLGEAFFKENKGYFWGYVPTRPYMRAKKGYADVCVMLDKMSEAIKHYCELLELNPNDNQGVRDHLLTVYIETMDWNAAKQLIQQYDEEFSAFFKYGKVLVEYGMNRTSSTLKSVINEAIEQNPFVPLYLHGKKQLPGEMPEFIGFGDEQEAIAYVLMNRHLWLTRPELLKLLPDHI